MNVIRHGVKRVLLVLPETSGRTKGGQPLFRRIWQPLDLANIAGLLLEKGIDVRIVDNRIERLSEFRLRQLGRDFDAVCVTSEAYDRWQCPSLHIPLFFHTVRCFPSEKTILLGPHVTARPDIILRQTGARAAVLGEPEMTVTELLSRTPWTDHITDIPGLAYLSNGVITKNPAGKAPPLSDISKPAFHLLPMAAYHYPFMDHPFTLMESSRGCPFHCAFCFKAMFPAGCRRKSPEKLVAEVAEARNRFNIRSVYFMDLEFGLDRNFLVTFCRLMAARNLNVTWCCQTRATDLDRETLALMKKAGCTLIHMGVESGSQEILESTGKNIGLDACRRAVSGARAEGIRTALFFNSGFPGETEKDRDKTLAAALDLDPDYAAFHMLIPYPGTPYAVRANIDVSRNPPDRLPSCFHTCHDERVLKAWVRKAYGKFYLRPGRIIRMIPFEKKRWSQKIALFARFWAGI